MTISTAKGECKIPDCERRKYCAGLCKGHWLRSIGEVPEDKPMKPSYAEGQRCSASTCLRPVFCKGLCNTHYRKKWAGDPEWNRPIRRRRINSVGIFRLKVPFKLYEKIEEYGAKLGEPPEDALVRIAEIFFMERRKDSVRKTEEELAYSQPRDGGNVAI